MSLPCNARCLHQRDGTCLLDDHRIRESRVEFGEDWDPAESCVGYIPRKEKESTKRRKK